MAIDAPRAGWAEQRPESWWEAAKAATERVLASAAVPSAEIRGIGISYQMHGLVIVDEHGAPVRPSIIWCDSRAVPIGDRAFEALGAERCLGALLNSPGNFTASKLAWVRENEPEVFERVDKMMLPGDYFAFRLTGRIATTVSGLSEGMLWDFSASDRARFLLDYYGIPESMVAETVPTFGEQGRLTESAAAELGLSPGTPVVYRAGDQPNNALSLNVLEPGEIAATAGTSGVVYGVSDTVRADSRSRVNSFAHVNHGGERDRLGILLCINGAGSSNRWLRETLSTSYDAMNASAAEVPVGADGLLVFPFGNGAERVLENRDPGASLANVSFNLHSRGHVARAVQEGVAFSFRYGMDVLGELGMSPERDPGGEGEHVLEPGVHRRRHRRHWCLRRALPNRRRRGCGPRSRGRRGRIELGGRVHRTREGGDGRAGRGTPDAVRRRLRAMAHRARRRGLLEERDRAVGDAARALHAAGVVPFAGDAVRDYGAHRAGAESEQAREREKRRRFHLEVENPGPPHLFEEPFGLARAEALEARPILSRIERRGRRPDADVMGSADLSRSLHERRRDFVGRCRGKLRSHVARARPIEPYRGLVDDEVAAA